MQLEIISKNEKQKEEIKNGEAYSGIIMRRSSPHSVFPLSLLIIQFVESLILTAGYGSHPFSLAEIPLNGFS